MKEISLKYGHVYTSPFFQNALLVFLRNAGEVDGIFFDLTDGCLTRDCRETVTPTNKKLNGIMLGIVRSLAAIARAAAR